jgi:hypothetical protein
LLVAERPRRRLRHRPELTVAVPAALVLALFTAAFLRDPSLPGLYMDAINPEYLIPGILHPPAPLELILPGNRVGNGLPVFTGTIYHGSTQLYAALPFMAVLGANLATFRFVQFLVGAAILVLLLRMPAGAASPTGRAVAIAAVAALAIDPSFVLALRTQAYSCLFPLVLLLGSVILLNGWQASSRPSLRLLVSGVLYGLAVFSYFIFGFFLPALVWLLLRRPADGTARRPFAAHLPWLGGCLIGYLPFICGLLLIRHAVGGTPELLDWLRDNRDQLNPNQDTSGLVSRIDTVATGSRRVFTGEWPWLMILWRHHTGLIDSLKADLLVLVPLLALFARPLTSAEGRRAIATPMALVVSFFAGALVFGSRLDGHHYTAILPLLYLAFGFACAALWPQSSQTSLKSLFLSRGQTARALLVVCALSLVAITSVIAQQQFHRGLQDTGGARLYSDAIDRFAEDVDRSAPNATVYAADWGFSMPLAFLTGAPAVRTAVDVEEIRQETCGGKPQLVVFWGQGNDKKAQLVADLARRPIASMVTWAQRNGVPLFQVARFEPTTPCPDAAAASTVEPDRRSAAIKLTPSTIPACAWLAQGNLRATVSWSVPRRARHDAELLVQAPGGAETLWTAGPATGSAETGPWAVAGMTFVLRDSVSKQRLATATMSTAPCPVS